MCSWLGGLGRQWALANDKLFEHAKSPHASTKSKSKLHFLAGVIPEGKHTEKVGLLSEVPLLAKLHESKLLSGQANLYLGLGSSTNKQWYPVVPPISPPNTREVLNRKPPMLVEYGRIW